MTGTDASLYGYNREVKISGKKITGKIIGCLCLKGRRGNRSRWFLLDLSDGTKNYFKAKDLRWADGGENGEYVSVPLGFYHCDWKV